MFRQSITEMVQVRTKGAVAIYGCFTLLIVLQLRLPGYVLGSSGFQRIVFPRRILGFLQRSQRFGKVLLHHG